MSHSAKLGGEFAAKALGDGGMLQHQRALQVLIRVQAAGQTKVALQVGPCLAKDLHDGFRHEITIAIHAKLRNCGGVRTSGSTSGATGKYADRNTKREMALRYRHKDYP